MRSISVRWSQSRASARAGPSSLPVITDAAMATPGRALIGTSGWSYKHWGNGIFYPPKLPTGSTWRFTRSTFGPLRSTTRLPAYRRARPSKPGARVHGRLRLRRQSEPLPDAHEKAAGSRRAVAAPARPPRRAGRQARPDPVPVPAALVPEPRAASWLPRGFARIPVSATHSSSGIRAGSFTRSTNF